MMNDRTCTNCEFMKKRDTYGGHCYRYPPIPYVSYLTVGQERLVQFDNLRPRVEDDEHCGEFSRSMPSLMNMMNEQKE